MSNVFEQDDSQFPDASPAPFLEDQIVESLDGTNSNMDDVRQALQESSENEVEPTEKPSEMERFLNREHSVEVDYEDEVFDDADSTQQQGMDDCEPPKTPPYSDGDSDSDNEMNRLWEMNDDRNYTRSPSTDLDQDMVREPTVSQSLSEQGPSSVERKRSHEENDEIQKENPLNKKKITRDLLDVVEVHENRVQ